MITKEPGQNRMDFILYGVDETMELPSKGLKPIFSVLRIGELSGKRRSLAEDIAEEFSDEYNVSVDKRSSLLALVKASDKLNKRRKRDSKLLKKMEKLVMMCADLRYDNLARVTTEDATTRTATKAADTRRLREATLSEPACRRKAPASRHGPVAEVTYERITRETPKYEEQVRAAHKILRQRLHEDEVESVDKMIGYMQEHENYIFVVAKQEGKIIGAHIGVVLMEGDTSVFFGQYIGVDKRRSRQGAGKALIESVIRETNAWLSERKLPALKLFFIESSQPTRDADEAKFLLSTGCGFGVVALPRSANSYVIRYFQPNLELKPKRDGSDAVLMMPLVLKLGAIGEPQPESITRLEYWKLHECIMLSYRTIDRIDEAHLDALRRNQFERLTGIKPTTRQLTNKAWVEKHLAAADARKEEPLQFLRNLFEIFNRPYELGPTQYVRVNKVTTNDPNWQELANDAQELLATRLPADEIYPPGTLARYVEQLDCHVLTVARDGTGKVIGMMSGTVGTYTNPITGETKSYIYGHYMAVAKDQERKLIAAQLYNDFVLSAQSYISDKGLPDLAFAATEASKPHSADNAAKLEVFGRRMHAGVVLDNHRKIAFYAQPSMAEGEEPVQMGLIVMDMQKPWRSGIEPRTPMDRAEYFGLVRAMYEGYAKLLGTPQAALDALLVRVLTNLGGGSRSDAEDARKAIVENDRKALERLLYGTMPLAAPVRMKRTRYAKA